MRILTFVILVLFLPAMLIAEEIIPIKIIVNTEDKGEYFVVLDDKVKDIYVVESDLMLLGIRLSGKRKKIDKQVYVSLKSLDPKLLYNLDRRKLILDLDIMPFYLSKTELNLESKKPKRLLRPDIDSAFLNYSIIHRGSSEQGFQSLDVPFETVVYVHDWLVQSNFNYHYNNINPAEDVPTFTRGLTNVTRDYADKHEQFILGDFISQSSEQGGSTILFGLSYRKKYNLTNYFTKYPGLSFGGLLQTPSRVNMYVNDVLLRSEQMSAGEFKINNLPNLYGAGKLKLEIIDAFGGRTVRYIPYYISSRLLRVGLDDFSYNFGFQRNSLTEELASYSAKPTFMGYHRWGLKEYLTTGYRFELSDKLSNVGVNTNVLVGSYGEIESGISTSRSHGDDGRSIYFRYSFTSQNFYGQYRFSSVDEAYTTLSIVDEVQDISGFNSLSFGVQGFKTGSIALDFTRTDYFSKSNAKAISIVYSLSFARRTSLLLRGVRTKDTDGTNNAIFVSINTSFGKKTSLNVTNNDQNDIRMTSASLQNASPIGTGLGYRVNVSQQENAMSEIDYLADVSLEGKMKYVSLVGSVFKGVENDTYLSQVAGSISYIDKDYYFSRPIIDSFSLVKVGDLDDVRVYFGNQEIDTTKNGRLIVPNLASYADNQISINAIDVPLDRSLKETKRIVTPKLRSGNVATFAVEQFQGFSGKLYFVLNKIEKTADFADLTLNFKGQSKQTMIGRKGEFYFENLAPGIHNAELQLFGKVCKFDIKIPESNATMVELGKHVCRY